MNDQNKIQYDIITWNDFDNIIENIAKSIENHTTSFDLILTVARGGLMPGVALSHRLGIRQVETIKITRTSDDSRNAKFIKPSFSHFDFSMLENKTVLIIEDIIDTGESMNFLVNRLNQVPNCSFTIATMVKRPNISLTYPITHCGIELSNWVVFPWEKNNVS